MPVTKKLVTLPAEFVQALSNYLSKRPYVEVADAMAVLLTTPVHTVIEPDKPEPAPAAEPAKSAEPTPPVADPAPAS